MRVPHGDAIFPKWALILPNMYLKVSQWSLNDTQRTGLDQDGTESGQQQ